MMDNKCYKHTIRICNIFIVKNSTKYFLAPQQWKENPLLRLHGNNGHLQIALIRICDNSNK